MLMANRHGADNGPRDTNQAAVRVLTAPIEPSERTGIGKDPAWKLRIHGLIDHPAADHLVSTK